MSFFIGDGGKKCYQNQRGNILQLSFVQKAIERKSRTERTHYHGAQYNNGHVQGIFLNDYNS